VREATWLRGAIPDLPSDDLLVGFPVKDEDFRGCCNSSRKRSSIAGAVRYSPQEGTRRCNNEDDVEDGVSEIV